MLWLFKTFVLSVVLNIMVDKGSLLSCVVVVVVIRKYFGMWDNIGASAAGVEDRDMPHRDEIAVSRHGV